MKFFHSYHKLKRAYIVVILVFVSLLGLMLLNPQTIKESPFKVLRKTKTAIKKPKSPAPPVPSTSITPKPTTKTALAPPPQAALAFNHTNIVTTFFWVGEAESADNGNIANSQSAWDGQWKEHYGGTDSPRGRNGYLPNGFTPKENPFYIALPYNDIDGSGNRKSTAVNCPLYATLKNQPYSWCKNSWLAIRHGDKIAYAQWEDAGPFGEDDTNYVFGQALPSNRRGEDAGLDVSPAVKDYLGLQDVDKTDWAFVPFSAVPDGPWKTIITITPGDSI